LKNTQISNFMKIRPLGAELFHADGQTDMKKLIVVFLDLANAPKNGKVPNCFIAPRPFHSLLYLTFLYPVVILTSGLHILKNYVLPIPPVSHTHFHLHIALTRTNGRSLRNFQKHYSFSISGRIRQKEVSFFFNFQNSEGLGC